MDLKVLPFTSQESYRGQVGRRENGETMFYLYYKEFKDEVTKLLRKPRTESNFWNYLYDHMSHEIEYRNKRFPLKLLQNIIPTTTKQQQTQSTNITTPTNKFSSTAVSEQMEHRENEMKNEMAFQVSEYNFWFNYIILDATF